MRARFLEVLALSGLALPLVAAADGGWAVITLDDVPDYAVVGQPLTLEFTVRQHGMTLLNGLKAEVEARSGATRLLVPAMPARDSGRYSATMTLPQVGDWTVTIYSGFGESRATLLPLTAVAPGKEPTTSLADAERGRRLFLAKGCFTCHLHRGFNEASIEVGPELTGTKLPADYIRQFLAEPTIAPRRPGYTTMPNLHLDQREIMALSAFLTAPSQALR